MDDRTTPDDVAGPRQDPQMFPADAVGTLGSEASQDAADADRHDTSVLADGGTYDGRSATGGGQTHDTLRLPPPSREDRLDSFFGPPSGTEGTAHGASSATDAYPPGTYPHGPYDHAAAEPPRSRRGGRIAATLAGASRQNRVRR